MRFIGYLTTSVGSLIRVLNIFAHKERLISYRANKDLIWPNHKYLLERKINYIIQG